MHCARGDVSAAEEAASILAGAGGAGAPKPLRGIMHAGAVLDSKVIANISAASIRTEFSGGLRLGGGGGGGGGGGACEKVQAQPAGGECRGLRGPGQQLIARPPTTPPLTPAGKVCGAQHLLQRSAPAALSVLQLFSSLAAFSGAAGQASYAAANGALDAWAHAAQVGAAVSGLGAVVATRLPLPTLPCPALPLHIPLHPRHPHPASTLQGQGRVGLAVQWGNWGGGGMAVRNKGFIERMERMGLGIGAPLCCCLWAGGDGGMSLSSNCSNPSHKSMPSRAPLQSIPTWAWAS